MPRFFKHEGKHGEVFCKVPRLEGAADVKHLTPLLADVERRCLPRSTPDSTRSIRRCLTARLLRAILVNDLSAWSMFPVR